MSVKEVFRNEGSNIKTYMCLTTDLSSTYPTNIACDPLSKMIVVNVSTHITDKYLFFDGTNWNEA